MHFFQYNKLGSVLIFLYFLVASFLFLSLLDTTWRNVVQRNVKLGFLFLSFKSSDNKEYSCFDSLSFWKMDMNQVILTYFLSHEYLDFWRFSTHFCEIHLWLSWPLLVWRGGYGAPRPVAPRDSALAAAYFIHNPGFFVVILTVLEMRRKRKLLRRQKKPSLTIWTHHCREMTIIILWKKVSCSVGKGLNFFNRLIPE